MATSGGYVIVDTGPQRLLWALLYKCCISFEIMNLRELSVKEKPGECSTCLLLRPPGSALRGLPRAVCLLTTCRANRALVGTQAAAAQCLGKLECGLQSQQTLIWTNTAVAWDLREIKLRGREC